jgi:hypothetical protein
MRAGWRRLLASTALVAGPWFVFSWFYLGSAVPDTLLLKAHSRGIWGKWNFFNGPGMYATSGWAGRPGVVAIAFAPAVLGAAALVPFRRLGAPVGLGAGAVAYYVVLALIQPGPYHWYYVQPTAALATFLAIAVGVWLKRAQAQPGRRALVPALALCGASVIALGCAYRAVRQGVPWESPLITTNWANARDYERVGKALRDRVGPAAVQSLPEVGTLAYYCECELIDGYSLRAGAVPVIDAEIDKAGTPIRQLLRMNYVWLDRGERVPRSEYQLIYTRGRATGRDVWNVWSRWNHAGNIRLVRLPSS